MSTRKKPTNFVQRLLKRVWRSFNVLFKALLNGVLRGLRVNKRRSRQSQAGFVLPTVVMVLMVVALLTTAIVIRSFDRSKNASNFRVDQSVLNAATPALDRARAKIERLFSPEENRLTTNPPSEGKVQTDTGSISDVLSQPQYKFGDETQLKLAYKVDATTKQTLETVWKFPVDTDNNGQYDTFTLYGIYFRNPPDSDENDKPDRARTPLEARALPQSTGAVEGCGTSSGTGGEGGWYETDGQLKKAFFVYVANVPITQADIDKVPTAARNNYQVYRGNKGFSALEMQQDQARISLDNNAVWYDDDLVISNVPTFIINGRIHTNSNLMVANQLDPSQSIIFSQVSSLDSCYYLPANGEISVGGNIAAGDVSNSQNAGNTAAQIHLYQKAGIGVGTDPSTNPKYINQGSVTTTLTPQELASNSGAYDKRLNVLVQGAIYLYNQQYPGGVVNDTNVTAFNSRFPKDVIDDFVNKYDDDDPSSGPKILEQALKSYFAKRIRRVSYKELGFPSGPYKDPLVTAGSTTPKTPQDIFPTSGGVIAPPTDWMPDLTVTTPDPNVPLQATRLEATKPGGPTGRNKIEEFLGDRIAVGNALATRWLEALTANASTGEPVTYADEGESQKLTGVNYTKGGGPRERFSRVEQLDDLGDTSRGGFWEQAAAYSGSAAKQYAELAGGLRVITGAGIYIDGQNLALGTGTGKRPDNSFLPEPPTTAELKLKSMEDKSGIKLPPEIQNATTTQLLDYQVVWPDTMPMFRWDDKNKNAQYNLEAGELRRGDLMMRATVVYHYATPEKNTQPDKAPIACIATFYDPTSPDTAQNLQGFTQFSDQKATNFGASINGINFPSSTLVGLRASANNAVLKRQANMIFPDGRWVNKPLKDALKHLQSDGVDKLTVNEIATIDAANCALTILYGASPQANSLVPDGAIQERTFLDARQIKAIHKRDTDQNGVLLKRPDGTDIDRQTFRSDITDPAKVKIAELGSLTTSEYSLPIEQRQPLEVRVTQLDLSQLRTKKVTSGGGSGITNSDEYMLPNSGIIYASRDDALPDISDTDFNPISAEYGKDKGGSATDFKLDPTRRPNGIRLINGENLSRDDSNTYRTVEKGLILASDLPVYIKGSFNLHYAPGTTNVIEEFTELASANFYGRTKATRSTNFACRVDQGGCTGKGDQWRSARILADAVTLLSKNFRDGYRNEGDFDLNNNIGNLAVEARLKNGFWWNDFVTSTQWYDTTGFPTQPSSYLTNGVTPVQRRVSFPEYQMEICRKLPVSACGATDWQRVDNANNPIGGTTGPYETSGIRFVDSPLYPRRVAFKRNQFGQLEPDDKAGCQPPTVGAPNPCKAIPFGVNASSAVVEVPYNSTAPALPKTTEAQTLWYLTTTSKTDPSAVPSYDYDSTTSPNLYYPPFDEETVSERQFLLPGMPEFPAVMGIAQSANGITGSDASDYAVFSVNRDTNACRLSQAYEAIGTSLGTDQPCPTTGQAVTAIGALWQRLRNPGLTPANNIAGVIATQALPTVVPGVAPAPDTLELKATAKVNIYNLPPSSTLPNAAVLSNLEMTLDRNGQDNPIFVFRTEQNLAFLQTVKVKLQGVEPNNIFWVSKLGTQIWGDQPHELVGNFIGGGAGDTTDAFLITKSDNSLMTDADFAGKQPVIKGGRILAFNRTYPNFPIPKGAMTAMTTTDQPLVIPVLQLHSPEGQPSTALSTAFGTKSINAGKWVQRINGGEKETYNAVLIMGDSPSRPFSTDLGESGGGLGNFPRFLEAWESAVSGASDSTTKAQKATIDIKGSFIQFKKSAFATAPFEAVDDPQKDNSLFFDNNNVLKPDYMTGFTDSDAGTVITYARPYIYKGGAQFRKAPYYRAGNREWGYDVGLLSQTPDLFARRFANPSVGTPNEYFRQVSRDDAWVARLLCATQPIAASAVGGAPTYEWAIADPQQRPSLCQAPQPGADDTP
jgi:type II secretory pathway pseudopilin PulG